MEEKIVGLDVETANASRASICAIGLALSDGTQRQVLVRPADGAFAPANVSIHGLQESDVADAPSFAEAIDALRETLRGALLACHNASFDVAALLAAARVVGIELPPMRAVCTLRIARATWPELSSHSLSALASHLGIPLLHHHAGSDATAARCVLERAIAVHGVTTVNELLVRTGQLAVAVEGQRADVIVSSTGVPVTTLAGLRIAFTGTLSVTRDEARARAEALGASTTDGISKALDILVVGLGVGSKLERAEALITAGHPLRIIDEREFGLLAWAVEQPSVVRSHDENARSRGGVCFSIDIADVVQSSPELQARIAELHVRREEYLTSLPLAARASLEAREADEEQAWLELEQAEHRLYADLVGGAERETARREQQAAADRATGRIGTQTEIGRRYGLSAVKVGKVLDEHGLRQLVDVTDDRYYEPMTLAIETYRREQDALRANVEERFSPRVQRERPPASTPEREPLRVMRGIVDGFATVEGYWIIEKVVPLIEPHAKRRA